MTLNRNENKYFPFVGLRYLITLIISIFVIIVLVTILNYIGGIREPINNYLAIGISLYAISFLLIPFIRIILNGYIVMWNMIDDYSIEEKYFHSKRK